MNALLIMRPSNKWSTALFEVVVLSVRCKEQWSMIVLTEVDYDGSPLVPELCCATAFAACGVCVHVATKLRP